MSVSLQRRSEMTTMPLPLLSRDAWLAQDIGGDILAGATSEFVQHRTNSTEDRELRGRPALEQRRPSRSNVRLTTILDVQLLEAREGEGRPRAS